MASLDRAVGLTPLRVLRLLRHWAATLLGVAQGLTAYRALGGRLPGRLEVAVASPAELKELERRLDLDLSSHAGDPNVAGFVAKRVGKAIGFVQYVYQSPDWSPSPGHWLSTLKVWRPYRGLGVGDALARRVISEARARGATELSLTLFNDNAPAGSLYRKLGFKFVVVPALEPTFEEEKRHGRRRIVMCKQLGAEN
jgi:ribosomal protein S18 acetylase RimI-like enzyme